MSCSSWSAFCRVDFAWQRDSICFFSFSIRFPSRESFSFCLLLTQLFTRSTASSTSWYNCRLFPSSLSTVSLPECWEELLFEFTWKLRTMFQRKWDKLTNTTMDYSCWGSKDWFQEWAWKGTMKWTYALCKDYWMDKSYKRSSTFNKPKWMNSPEHWLKYLNR